MGGVYEVYIETHFSAAHALRGYPGDCARLHGHNWMIRVYVKCLKLDETGIGIDFRLIKEHVKDVLSGLDHFNINECPPFHDVNPSSENIAKYLYQTLSEGINTEKIKISRIRVSETPNAGAYYWEE